MKLHTHGPGCEKSPVPCSRNLDLDSRQVTDILKIRAVQKTNAETGRQPRNEPPWWASLAIKAGLEFVKAFAAVSAIGIFVLARHCGAPVP